MQTYRTLVVLIGILLLIIAAQRNVANKNQKNEIKYEEQTLGNSEAPTSTPTETSTPSSTITLTPTTKPSNTPTPVPSKKIEQDITFIYPNSTILENSASTIRLQSTDDPKRITEWYQDLIKQMGMKAKSFVKTNANGKVRNLLAGTNNTQEITVEISKKPNESTVFITITLQTSVILK